MPRVMNPVRIWGDPLAGTPAAARLRAFLAHCQEQRFRAGLCLTALQPGATPAEAATTWLELTDGARTLRVAAPVPAADLERIRAAADSAVPATAPVVVFAEPAALADATALAGLEWPAACRVLPAHAEALPADLLARVRAELRWAGTEDPACSREPQELAPFLALPLPADGTVIVHPGSEHPADGTDLMLSVFARHFAAAGHRLRVVLEPLPEDPRTATQRGAELLPIATAAAPVGVEPAIEFVPGPLRARHLLDAAVVAMPLRADHGLERVVDALASGRPVCLSRWHATAALVPAPGLCLPVGGRLTAPGPQRAGDFAPDPAALAGAIAAALDDRSMAAAVGRRARGHAAAELVADRPGAAAPWRPGAIRPRPVVVLEAPLLEVSSSAELTIDTARALLRRGNVDLRLRPRTPFHRDLGLLRARAPELIPLLTRGVIDADLWLTCGWPPRTDRPRARRLAVRFDYEYGALPTDLAPLLTDEADQVVVHSRAVRDLLLAAGRRRDGVTLLPHGVDGDVFHPAADPLPEVVRWRGDRPVVAFVGGPIWRKGFDLFLQAVLGAAAAGANFAVVIKTVGDEQHYAGHGLGELVDRLQRTAGAPPVLRLQRDLTRAELAGLYCASDVLLHPYRGEGFGLPVLEARACGLPVLVTDGGSTDDFCAGPGVDRIPARRRSVQLPARHLGAPWVLEPDAAAAASLLLETLADLPARRNTARVAAAEVRARWTWDAAAAGIEALAGIGTAPASAAAAEGRPGQVAGTR